MPSLRPGLAGIIAEYLVFDPDPAAAGRRRGGDPPIPPPLQKTSNVSNVSNDLTNSAGCTGRSG